MNGLMQFDFGGDTYVLEFERVQMAPLADKKHLPEALKPEGGVYPNATKRATVASLWKIWNTEASRLPLLMASGVARCHHKDKFVKEIGRVEALRRLKQLLLQSGKHQLAEAVQKCYEDRLIQAPKIETKQVMD